MRTEDRHLTDHDRGSWDDPAANGIPSDNDSLTGVLRDLGAIGFGASYRPAREPVEGRVAVVCGACGRSTAAEDLRLDVERRLEGASEPDEMVLVVAATCPACGTGGVIVLGYGPEASPEDSDIVLALLHPPAPAAPPAGPTAGPGGEGDDGEDDGSVADPGGDSDPDANEGFEPPSDQASGASHESGASGPSGLGRIGAALDASAGLDRVADPIHRTLDAKLPDSARSVLQGRWLGHPVHPFLTDVVIGFWTSAWILDLVGGEATEDVADAFVAAGVAAAVPTVWSGWADWIELPRGKRRAGLVHAASNATATALYAASLVARRRGRRGVGVGLGHAAATAATVGGFLGGHLAFGD